jgi:3-dehydroquinate synthase
LKRAGDFVSETTAARRVLVVSDSRVAPLYAGAALRSLRRAGIAAELAVVPQGERSKSAAVLARLWSRLAEAGIERGDAVVALGGGVVGDLAGFAAATWLRGVPWVAIPTSLLAQVDSSVGGKTAIDLAEGKNLAGAFHQPAGVLVDAETLATLPARHVRAGLAEVVKKGFAVDAALFRWCEHRIEALAARESGALAEAAERAVRAKARVVTRDEREAGARAALNFGHTTAHALEAALGYRRVIHGEAVAIGMRVAAGLSVPLAGLAERDRLRLERVLDALALPRRLPPVPIERLIAALRLDKKRARGETRWVLTPRVGFASVPRLISGRLVRAALLAAGARG